MKKIFALFLAFVFVFTMLPCYSVCMADADYDGFDDIYYEDEYTDVGYFEGYLSDVELLYAAKTIDRYVTNNKGELPKYVTVLRKKIYMPELIGIFAQFIIYAENGENLCVVRNAVTTNSTEYESLNEGLLTREEYVALAYDTVAYINKKFEAPGYINTKLGALSFSTIISVFSKVLTDYRNQGAFCESVEVSKWASSLPLPPEESVDEFDTEAVLNAALAVRTYIANNNACPSYTTINDEKVYMAELIGLLSRVIIEKDSRIIEETVVRNDAAYIENSYEALNGVILLREEYVQAAEIVLNYIEGSLFAAAPGYVSTSIGDISAENLIKTFSYICAALKSNGSLPESVVVEPWYSSLPTPPQATETPQYEYLNFIGILKGARRVMDATEAMKTVPNYVTLDAETKIYPGTMLRLFAATVSNINRGKATNMPLQEVATPKNVVSETLTSGTFTKASYTKIASRIADVIYTNNAVPTYITTEIGTMNYYNMIYLYSRVLEYYLTYGFLPDTIDVQPWGTYEF